MKKILGLDLGSASIGWALITEDQKNIENKIQILGLGSRIIPYEGTEGKDFAKGTGESRNSLRTKARTARKGYDRYQLRRKNLTQILFKHGMLPNEELKSMPKMQLWELRKNAVEKPISLQELGRILLLLNQKRGYKSSRSDANLDKKDTDYVAQVKSRHHYLKEQNLTIGQHFYLELLNNEYFRIKDNIYPREAYIEEYNAICERQKVAHPTILTEELIRIIRDEIIYYQRRLKSCKGLVSVCEFEGFMRKGKDGKEYFVGPKVAPKSSPLFQITKMWENINNIEIKRRGTRIKSQDKSQTNLFGDEIDSLSTNEWGKVVLTSQQKQEIFDHLDNNEKLNESDLLRILNLNKKDCIINKQLVKGLQGNTTKCAIIKCFGLPTKYEHLLKLEAKCNDTGKENILYDPESGEIYDTVPQRVVVPDVEKQPLYQLWHTIYSISDFEECRNVLIAKFKIEESIAEKLAMLDFTKQGFGNKSTKTMRKILPYLIEGNGYSKAMEMAGYNHSNSLTKDENLKRQLLEKLKPIEPNSLRQPIVEKILNQMVNLVNAIIDKYGKPDEIRIELARELKQSKDERNDTTLMISAYEKIHEEITKRLAEINVRGTKKNIEKYKFIFPVRNVINKDGKVETAKLKTATACPQCIYCGQPFSLTDALLGDTCDVDHIIPKKLLFDDSQTNKVLVHRKCNQNDKGGKTAYDFIRAKGQNELENYLARVDSWYKLGIISNGKRAKLLVSHEDYLKRKTLNKISEEDKKTWESFLDRQLRETQYISKKAREKLHSICYNVWCTSGDVTAKLRHLWGWDDVTMNLQMPKYKELGLTTIKEWESEHGRRKHTKEVITDWCKRDDHRHHAIDALTIACTKQGYIQRFNTLNSSKTREDMQHDIDQKSATYQEKFSLLEKYIIGEQPLSVATVEDAVSNILISYKAGKKVAVFGKRKIGKKGDKKVVQEGIIVPRGQLSEESVYGKIRCIDEKKPIKYLFENPQLIIKPYIKKLVENRLAQYENDVKKALASLKKEPIFLNSNKTILLEYGTCYKEEFVIKYTVDPNFNKVDKVIDSKIKQILQTRLAKFGGKAKEAFRDVQQKDKTVVKWYEDEGLERPINSVRCFTGLTGIVAVKKDENGRDIGFVKPGNNHHIAIYKDENGARQAHICSFWHAVERKEYRLPVIIKDSSEIWDNVLLQHDDKYPQDFLEKLPQPNWKLEVSMQQNEMFVMGLTNETIQEAIEHKDYKLLSDKLYRIQKMTIKPSSGAIDLVFRHHLETQIIDDNNAKMSNRFLNLQSLSALFALNPQKIAINVLGQISDTLVK